jgi:probable HAF family extracellular repeat protein
MSRLTLLVAVIAPVVACGDVTQPASPDVTGSRTRQDASLAVSGRVVTRIDLGTLGGSSSYATDINNHGAIVGWSQVASGVNRAFRWTAAEGMVDLGALAGHQGSRAISVTDDGRVLGVSGDDGWTVVPVVWSDAGVITELLIPLLPGAEFGSPSDFNERGDVVGWDVVALQRAWSWNETRGKHDITADVPGGSHEGIASAVNASGLVLGTSGATVCPTPECWRAFLWSADGGYRDLGTPTEDPSASVTGLDMNETGSVVGWVQLNTIGVRPYRWSDAAGFTVLRSVSQSYATAINARGIAAGASWNPTHGAFQAVVWPKTRGVVKLSPDDPYPHVAVAINDAGRVAGWSSLDCCGGVNHATLWILGPARRSLKARARPDRSAPPELRRSVPGAAGCLTDTDALVSRAALFACVARSDIEY